MRILIVGDYPPDPRLGSPKVMFKLREELRRLGHTCDAVFSDEMRTAPSNPYLRQAFGPVAALVAVRRWCQRHGAYDVIDVAGAEGMWLGVWRRLGGFRDTAIVSRTHGLEHLNYQRLVADHDAGLSRKPWTRRWFHPAVRLTQVAAAARAADRLIVLNDLDKEFVIRKGWKTAGDIDLVPHGVSSQFLEGVPSRLARGGGVLFCGGWSAMKGVSYLADAFSILVADGFRTNLTILGGAVPEQQILSAFSIPARAQVTIVDRVDEAEVIATYRAHDLLVLPSTYEGFGMVLLEAMSQRLAVVATPFGAARSLIIDGQTGLLVPARDAVALAAAIARMMHDPALRVRLADCAFEQVQGMTWNATARRTLEVYERARTRNRRGGVRRS